MFDFRSGSPLKEVLWAVLPLLVVLLLEVTRAAGIAFPVPFLILYVSVVIAASFGGRFAGAAAGAVGAGYVVFAAYMDFGPATLTGGPVPVASGIALYLGSGLVLGWNLSRKLKIQKAELREKEELLQAATAAQERLRESEARFRTFATSSSDWLWEMDKDLKFTWISDGREHGENHLSVWSIGKTRDEVSDISTDMGRWLEHLETLRQRKPFRDFTYRADKHATPIWLRVSGTPIFSDAGEFLGYRGVSADITREVELEQETATAQSMLAQAVEGLKDSFTLWDTDDRLVLGNRVFRLRYPEMCQGAKPGIRFEDFARYIVATESPELDSEASEELVRSLVRQHKTPGGVRERQLQDGTRLLISEQKLSNGFIASVAVDVTNLKMLEEQLVKSQRLEAIGQLTGGTAHDFNNLLAVIQGSAELLRDSPQTDMSLVEAILRASEKGATLTRQLLAFSRKQTLHPAAIDLREMIDEMTGMLSRTIGEEIVIERKIDGDLWHALADPVQLETALINLVLNARDAMPHGGTVEVKCSNAEIDGPGQAGGEITAGQYVVLTVTDHGTGMPEATRARAFEPFFTTKGIGQGSGMGLPMVYGFARQSGGHVVLESEVGSGTTVRLYLPRSQAGRAGRELITEAEIAAGDGQTILVIEDNPEVLELTRHMLTKLGYSHIAASDIESARKILASGEAVDLVLSDVVLPGGMNGPEFREEVAAAHPDLQFVFMSGFPSDPETGQGSVAPGNILLNKPFRVKELSEVLQQAFRASHTGG